MIPAPVFKEGDAIGVYSPSSGIEDSIRSNYERGKKFLTDKGYTVIEAPHTHEWQAHYSALGDKKIEDIRFLLGHERIKAILPSVGGTTSYQMIEGFPYPEIASAKKMWFGFSDNSLQTAMITSKTGLVTFFGHSDIAFGLGDLAASDGPSPLSAHGDYTERMFFDTLLGQVRPGPIPKATDWRCLRPGTARGKLLGGDLDVLQILHGTQHELDLNGAIFFWEASGLELHRVDLILAGYRLAGLFDELVGMVIGKADGLTETFFEEKHESFEEIVLRNCQGYRFPIIFDADIGHDMACAMLPLGVKASIEGDELILLEDPYDRT